MMESKKITLQNVEEIINTFYDGRKNFLDGVDFVVGMSRGGLVPAALLAAKINKPLVAAYINKQDEIFFDRADWIKDENILVVDDIIRSGKTLWLLKDKLIKNYNPKVIHFFTLYRVAPLADEQYYVPSFSREINHDIVFPWDYDRK